MTPKSPLKLFKAWLETSSPSSDVLLALKESSLTLDEFSSLVICACNACSEQGLEVLTDLWSHQFQTSIPLSMRGLPTIYQTFGLEKTRPWLEAGVDIQSQDGSYHSVLMYAIIRGHLSELDELLSFWKTPTVFGAYRGVSMEYSSGLYWASSKEVMRWLVDHGADLNAPSINSEDPSDLLYPITKALRQESPRQLRQLLELGAYPQCASSWISDCLKKDLGNAFQNVALQQLTQHGYDWNTPYCPGKTQLEQLEISFFNTQTKVLAKASQEKRQLEATLSPGKFKITKHL